jgi:hypothetical protein
MGLFSARIAIKVHTFGDEKLASVAVMEIATQPSFWHWEYEISLFPQLLGVCFWPVKGGYHCSAIPLFLVLQLFDCKMTRAAVFVEIGRRSRPNWMPSSAHDFAFICVFACAYRRVRRS